MNSRVGAVLIAVVTIAGSAGVAAAAGRTQAKKDGAVAAATGEAAALTSFRNAIGEYMGLRAKLRAEIPPMKVTPNAAEINATSDALARAVQRARVRARQGTLFTPTVAGAMRRLLERALAETDRAAVFALIGEEEAALAKPTIHGRFPAGGVLASTPPVLLHALPPLPSELEYRFVGRTLVVRDVEAALILDFLPAALPAK